MKNGHVLIIPSNLQGHVSPLVYMAKRIIERGALVTFIIPRDDVVLLTNSPDFKADMFKVVLVDSLDSFVPQIPIPNKLTVNMERACERYMNQILADKDSGLPGDSPTAILSDMFQGWTQDWANKLKIPRYCMFPSPALFALIMVRCSRLVAEGKFKSENEVIEMRSVPPLLSSDFPRSIYKLGQPEFLTLNGDRLREAQGVLVNSFYELESGVIDDFHEEIKPQPPNLITIGPILPHAFLNGTGLLSGPEIESESIQWLNAQPVSSVIFVAFGTLADLTKQEIGELALGLEASQVRFLWALRPPKATDAATLLPEGFLNRTKERGLVVLGYAPQLHILSHPSTGGFYTHCGWNSLLESLCRGVPTVGCPLMAEQKINSKYLVHSLQLALDVKRDEPIRKEDVLNNVRRLMLQSEEGEELRQRVKQCSIHARAAAATHGSSGRNFDKFLDAVAGIPLSQSDRKSDSLPEAGKITK